MKITWQSRRALTARINRKLPQQIQNGYWIIAEGGAVLTDSVLVELAQELGVLSERELVGLAAKGVLGDRPRRRGAR